MKGFTVIEICIVAVSLGLLGLVIFVAVPAQQRERNNFVASCVKFGEPEYQCQLKWKQMHSGPIVVYAPMNR
jgi:hypothetical protein